MQRPLSTLSCFLGFLTFLDGLRCVVGVSWRGSWISAVFGSHHYLSALLGIALSFWILVPRLTSSPPSNCFACFLLSVVELPSPSSGRAMAMPMVPRTPAEVKKSLARSAQPPLAEGRPVRDKYFRFFESWTKEEGIDIHALLEHSHQYVEEINIVVSRFGRELFKAGKTYNQYAETINSLTSTRPSLRRQMQGAWDLGFAWMRQEPTQHHVAIPSIILIAMITTSLLWGWVRFAGCLALGWGSLLRPGEIFSLRRLNLLFPEDSGFSIPYVLVSLQEPKSRFTHDCETSKHEAGRSGFDTGGMAKFWQAAAQ